MGDHPYGDFVGAGAVNDDASAISVHSDGCPSDHIGKKVLLET